MMSPWLQDLKGWLGAAVRPPRRGSGFVRLQVERLERRTLFSVQLPGPFPVGV